MSTTIYHSQVVTTVSDDLINQWKSLWNRTENANAFNSYQWFAMALRTSTEKKYQILCTFRGQTLVGIFPLFRTKVFGVPVWGPANYHFSVNTPFLVESYEKELIQSLFEKILRENLYISKLDMPAVEVLSRLFPSWFFSLISINPYIPLSQGPFSQISKSNLNEMRRVMRKYADQLSFKIFDDQKEMEKLLPVIFSIDQQSAKQKRSMGTFDDPEKRQVFTDFIRDCSEFIRIAVLYFEGKPVAYVCNFVWKSVFLPYQASYLFEYRKISPGKTIMMKILESLEGSSYTMFDFSGGISAYKRDFTSTSYIQYNLYQSNNSLILLWWKAINSLRRVKQILFPLRNTNDHLFLFKTLEKKGKIQ